MVAHYLVSLLNYSDAKLRLEGSEIVSYNFNPLTTNAPHHIETSQMICRANQLTGFYMIGNIGC